MPRNKYPEETIRKILDVSLELFLEKGYEKTTILDIVNNLGGLTRGAIYHHFKSKEEVYNALTERLFQENSQFGDIAERKDLSGLEKIKTIFSAQIAVLSSNREYRKIQQMNVSMLNNPHFLAAHIKNNRETAKEIAFIIEEGMSDGSIRAGDSKVLADLVMMLINFWILPSIYPCCRAEFMARILAIKQIFDCFGFPVFDEEITERASVLADILGVPPE